MTFKQMSDAPKPGQAPEKAKDAPTQTPQPEVIKSAPKPETPEQELPAKPGKP